MERISKGMQAAIEARIAAARAQEIAKSARERILAKLTAPAANTASMFALAPANEPMAKDGE